MQLFHFFEDWAFSIDALDGPTDALDHDTAPVDVLRTLLRESREPLPIEGWRTLVSTDDAAVFATGDLATGMTVATVAWFDAEAIRAEQPHAQTIDSQWISRGVQRGIRSFGVAPDPGDSRARWWLNPAVADQRGRSVLDVFATDPHCASGRPTGDRLRPATVVADDDQVVVSFAARRLTGAQMCPSHPPTPATVELDRPLGDRALLDGGWWPHRPAATSEHPWRGS